MRERSSTAPLWLCRHAVILWLSVWTSSLYSEAFLPPSRPGHGSPRRLRMGHGAASNHRDGDNNNDNNNMEPPSPPEDVTGVYDTPLPDFSDPPCRNDTLLSNHSLSSILRGGGSSSSSKQPPTKQPEQVVTSSLSFWKGATASVVSTVTAPFRSVQRAAASAFQSKEAKQEQALLEQLRTVRVQRVAVPNSTVLPPDVVQIAAQRSGVLGSPLQSRGVSDLAATLKRWYVRQGYILHAVTGATLRPESRTAELSVQEPVSSQRPVHISFYKQMVIDDDTGDVLTFAQHKERYLRKSARHNNHVPYDKIPTSDWNTTFVETTGRTKPHRIAAAMAMHPGRPFQWDSSRWQRVATSGIFKRILQATPQPLRDGTVQLHIVAQEAPSRHLEYGLGKSLYTGGWEGELDFEHANVFGGAETLGLSVRQGSHDSEPSARLKFSDGRLGLAGGYDVEVFSEFVGDPAEEGMATEGIPLALYDRDLLTSRRGTTFRIRNPIDPHTIRHSVASISLERTSTKTGLHETIGSTTMDVGPFLRELPLGARSNVDCSFTTGSRFAKYEKTRRSGAADDTSTSSSSSSSTSILPYASVSATTRQLFPLFYNDRSSGVQRQQQRPPRRPLLFALRHSATVSTRQLPRHVAKMIGTSCNIRGATLNGRVASALRGTVELRVPIQLPTRLCGAGGAQDASMVVFSDWLLSSKDPMAASSTLASSVAAAGSSGAGGGPFTRKSSVGLGFRKSIQGIPLQYDISYSEQTKLRATFGLGHDFVF